MDGHDMADMSDWKPADGIQRTAFTSVATIATAAGFALILLAGMLASGDEITVRKAFGWSLAAFVATGLAPSLRSCAGIAGQRGRAVAGAAGLVGRDRDLDGHRAVAVHPQNDSTVIPKVVAVASCSWLGCRI